VLLTSFLPPLLLSSSRAHCARSAQQLVSSGGRIPIPYGRLHPEQTYSSIPVVIAKATCAFACSAQTTKPVVDELVVPRDVQIGESISAGSKSLARSNAAFDHNREAKERLPSMVTEPRPLA